MVMWLLGAVVVTGEVVVWNKYTTRLGPIGEQYPWRDGRTIVDAWAPWSSQLRVNGEAVEANWTLVGDHNVTWSGPREVEVDVGAYTLEAAHGPHRESLRLLSMYVRREYRELDDDDRVRFLTALKVVYDTASGSDQMGPDFLGMDFLVRLHHETAAQRDADHMHQGVGFLAQHAKLSMLLEQSLRTVDKRAGVLPYWDPTIEADGDIWATPMWSADWFGSIGGFQGDNASLQSDTWAIQDGVFAMLRSPISPKTWLPQNAYGYLRAPWNANNSPYVTRYPRRDGHLPTCTIHRLFGESTEDVRGGDDWTNRSMWMYDVSNAAHGAMHSTPGGFFAVGDTNRVADAYLKANGVDTKNVKQHTLWRFRVLDFPDHCDELVDCAPQCNLDLWTNLTAVGYEIVKAQAKFPSDDELARISADAYADIAKAYCGLFDQIVGLNQTLAAQSRQGPDLYISGDAKDAGGSIDPTFWPIHPAITRLYQYRILFGPAFRDEAWYVNNSCYGARSEDEDRDRLAFALDGARVGNSTLGLPPSNSYQPDGLVPCGFEDCCGGHFGSSQLYQRYPDKKIGLTNAAMMDLVDPRTGPKFDQPIYHHFLFPHCEAAGIHFRSAEYVQEGQ